MDKQTVGKLGEDTASRYLALQGYKIVERNYRTKWGELDIVALAPDKTLVFCEVKTVSGPDPQISGEDQLTKQKLRKLRRTAQIYAGNRANDRISSPGWRIDLITIIIEGDKARVRHYRNI